MTIRITAAPLIALAALVFAASGAERNATEAAYPEPNGRISFVIQHPRSYSIQTMNPDGTDLALVDIVGQDFGPLDAPSWSPDGSQIVYYATGGIRITSADGSDSRVVPNTEDVFFFVTWSPDGSKLAFSGIVDGGLDIFTIATDGSNKTNITNTPAEGEAYLEWSPNGEKIALATSRSGLGSDIEVIDADGSNRFALTDTPGVSEVRPSWSPDGKHLIFEQSPAGSQSLIQIARVDADGLNHTILTGTDRRRSQPAYSPDGKKIVFYSRSGIPPQGIAVMDADGGNEVIISESFGGLPDWGSNPVTNSAELIWGDANCSGDVGTRDSQAILRFVLDQSPLSLTPPCLDIGEAITVVGHDGGKWGDWDCDGTVGTRDSQGLLRFVLEQPALSQTGNCPDIGDLVQVASQ